MTAASMYITVRMQGGLDIWR